MLHTITLEMLNIELLTPTLKKIILSTMHAYGIFDPEAAQPRDLPTNHTNMFVVWRSLITIEYAYNVVDDEQIYQYRLWYNMCRHTERQLIAKRLCIDPYLTDVLAI